MYKQVIVIRSDISISKGKIAVQVAHASLMAAKKVNKRMLADWEKNGQKKIVVKVDSERELLEAKKKCAKLHIPHSLISDAGLTEVKSGTITALGIGPDKESTINKVTGSLKLLK